MKRPKGHVTGKQGENALEKFLEQDAVLRSYKPDFAIDYSAEFVDGEEMTGNFFYIQLKSTSKKSKNGVISHSLQKEYLDYYSKLPLPIMLVIYSVSENRFWGSWVNECHKIVRNKSLNIIMDKSNLLDKSKIIQLKKTLDTSTHKKINVKSNATTEMEKKYHNKVEKILKKYYPDELVFNDGSFPLFINFDYKSVNNVMMLKINYNVSGVTKIDINIDEKLNKELNYGFIDFENISDAFRKLLFNISQMLADKNIGSSMKLYNNTLFDVEEHQEVISSICHMAKIALNKGEIKSYQELTRRAIDLGKVNEFQFLQIMYMGMSNKVKNLDFEEYRNNYKLMIAKLGNDDDDMKGMLNYNMGNSYLLNQDNINAFKCYNEARKLKPDYLDMHYWWGEVGATLFNTGRFKCAERAYIKSNSIFNIDEPFILAYIGESIMHQGRFTDAVKWFKKYCSWYEKNGMEKNPEVLFCLKCEMAERMVEEELDGIKPNRTMAINISKDINSKMDPENAIDILKKAIRFDPLYTNAWFDLGSAYLRKNDSESAMKAFLNCSAIHDGDREAWLNALFSALKNGCLDVTQKVLTALKIRFGNSIFPDIINAIEQFPAPADKKADMFEAIETLFNRSQQKATPKDNAMVLLRKFINYEHWILSKSNPKVPENIPAEYNILIQQDPSSLSIYRHYLMRFLRKEKGDSKILDEIDSAFLSLGELDRTKLITYFKSKEITENFTISWQNAFNSLGESALELNDNILFFYQNKYEIEAFIMFLGAIYKNTGDFDTAFESYKDRTGKLQKGKLLNEIKDHLNSYPELKNAVQKAYSPKLRNTVGHNEYQIIDDTIFSVDKTISIPKKEFFEALKLLELVQNSIHWLISMYSDSEVFDGLEGCGVIDIGFGYSENKEPVLILHQLWPFYNNDHEKGWLSKIVFQIGQKHMKTVINQKVYFKGNYVDGIKDWMEKLQKRGKLYVGIVSIEPYTGSRGDSLSLGCGIYQNTGNEYSLEASIEVQNVNDKDIQ